MVAKRSGNQKKVQLGMRHDAENADLQLVLITQIQRNPLNPRQDPREELRAAIAASLKEEGHQRQYALIIRPHPTEPGQYEMLDGDLRWRAASQAGLSHVWCWVRPLTDEEAAMEIALSNRQNGFTDLERGIYVLRTVELGIGGKGKKGGLAAFARILGKDPSIITEQRQAATVSETVGLSQQLNHRRVIKHLTAIWQAPESLWQVLCEHLMKHDWNLKEAEAASKKAQAYGEIDEVWQKIFLPLPDVLDRGLTSGGFEPETVQKLARAAQQGEDRISSYAGETASIREEYHKWLKDGARDYSWNLRRVYSYLDELRARLETEDIAAYAAFQRGDWRDHIHEVPDQSGDAAILDHPYGTENRSLTHIDHDRSKGYKYQRLQNDTPERAPIELAEGLAAIKRKLKPDSHLICFCHWRTEPEVRQIITQAGFTIRGRLIWSKGVGSRGDTMGAFAPSHEPIIHATLGSPTLYVRELDVLVANRPGSERHPCEKPTDLLRRLIAATTVEGNLVLDLWAGVASTLVAARQLRRRYWGSEIEVEYHRIGVERLWKTGEADPDTVQESANDAIHPLQDEEVTP